MLLFGRPVFIAYFSALGGVALIMFMISSRLKIKLDRRLAEHEYTSVSIADYDQAADDSDTGSQAHGTPLEASSQRKWVGAGFAATGASLASQSILIGDTV